ncbi:MAG TPA: hypothetical protein VGG20_20915 [Thermoanaerobaculia bacterium]|jgi:hypothetical protein
MKKLGIMVVLMLLLGAVGVWAADSTFMIRNDTKGAVMVSAVWSGGNVPPTKLGAGESMSGGMSVPANIDSVKVEVTGDCKKGSQTFNPQHVTQAIIHCKGGAYTVMVGNAEPKP